MARVERATHLDAPPDTVWEHVQTPRLLDYVARGMISFAPKGPRWPAIWEPGTYQAALYLFGVIPIGWQAIRIMRLPFDGTTYRVRDNGWSPLIRRWEHVIEITPEGSGTRYVDRIDIDAGLLTPFVASFARIFYAHRQRRWRLLVANGFDYAR